MPLTTTENEQVIEAVVSGPGTANRLYLCRTNWPNTAHAPGPGVPLYTR